jgi:hypothetical protein
MPNKLILDVKSSEFQRQADNARKVLQPLIAGWVHELMEITGRSYKEWPTVAQPVDPVEPTDTESISWFPEEVSRIRPSGLPDK